MDERLVVVTGVSRGLGLCIAQDLLKAGYAVVGCSRTRSKEMDGLEASGKFTWIRCEVGNEEDEIAFMKEVVAVLGDRKLYGLVNNAGIAVEGVLATFPTVDAERVLQVNLLGAMRMTRLFLRATLGKRHPCRIVNISSIVGLRGYTGLAAYSMSKAGMDAMTRSLARELGGRQVTVNSVAPGYLRTEISASLSDRQREQITNRTPLGRLGEVEDVAPVVRFLLSEEAAFITGHTLVVDGGITC